MSIAQRRFNDRNAIARQARIAQVHGISTKAEGHFRKHHSCAPRRPSVLARGDRREFGGVYGLTLQELKFDQMVRAEHRAATNLHAFEN